jgi:hypothetical protein
MDKRQLGIYHKYYLSRTDGKDGPGQKHEFCEYYVLDLDHDVYALAALSAYANACAVEYPKLSAELMAKVNKAPVTSFPIKIFQKDPVAAGYLAGLSAALHIVERDAAINWKLFRESSSKDNLETSCKVAIALDRAGIQITKQMDIIANEQGKPDLLDVIVKQKHQIDELKKLVLTPANLTDDIIDAPRSFLQLTYQTSVDYATAKAHLEMSGKHWPKLAPNESRGHISKAGVAITVYRAMEEQRLIDMQAAVDQICNT